MIIYMKSVEGSPKKRALTKPLSCMSESGMEEFIPVGFIWDGSSVPALFQGIFPRHKHPISSARHDWRCRNAKNKADRKYADAQFKKDVGKTSWGITANLGYIGVRIGAFFGVGSNF